MFTQSHIKQLSDRGISLETAAGQLEIFKKGISPVKLVKPAIPGDGIEVFNKLQTEHYVGLYRKEKDKISKIKFVPASGAASRMFKQLFEALGELNKDHDPSVTFKKMPEMDQFFKDLRNYPFSDDLSEVVKMNQKSIESLIKSGNYAELLDLILSSHGLSYGVLPKGLLKFHKYATEARTAFEEHFSEASLYMKDNGNIIKLHFTVSPEHRELFQKLSADLIKKYIEKHNVSFDVSFSEQKPSTDTIAAGLDNKPFLVDGDKLLFRPGGHGALLDNMQDIKEKMIFVGNIDNVAPVRTQPLRAEYKELLGGILIERVQMVHRFLNEMETGLTDKLFTEIIDFTSRYISESSARILSALKGNDFVSQAVHILNRPVRVCGMVKNVGEPGGGPFWISDSSGNISKQIIESAQVDLTQPDQDAIFKKATHFNPVDMACYTSDHKDRKFRLGSYRDPEMAFIAIKSQGGSSLKALELPGLWNGSMAGWLTFFVDVPVETFSPVKTIFDLRRPEHIA